jgi:hypothetical protein
MDATATVPKGAAERDATRLEPLAAPSPDMIVVASRQQAIVLEEQARAQEAALHAEHAAEVARLHQALRDLRIAHAAEIERLHREHASELRRIVEAQRRRRDAVQAVVPCPNVPQGRAEPPAQQERTAPSPQLPYRPQVAREWLARIRRRG